jgi:hypothetical protein
MTFGQRPYQWLSNEEVIAQIPKGVQLPQPEQCPATLYAVMQACWQLQAAQRPSFTEVIVAFVVVVLS